MTNLLFGTDYYFKSGTHTSVPAAATGYSQDNLWSGATAETWKGGSANTRYDLAARVNPAVEGVNYVAVYKPNLCVYDDSSVRFTFIYSDDFVSWTTFKDVNPITAADLVGPNSESYIYYYSGAIGANKQGVALTIYYTSAGIPELSKFYAGTALDIGRDPTMLQMRRMRDTYSARKPRYRIDLGYTDISYANAMKIITQIGRCREQTPIVLFTATNHGVLNNAKCIWAQLVALDTPQEITNKNNITMSFQELL